MNTQLKHSRGFTVVELVMAVAVGIVLLAAVSTAVVSGQRSSTGIERKVTTNQDARGCSRDHGLGDPHGLVQFPFHGEPLAQPDQLQRVGNPDLQGHPGGHGHRHHHRDGPGTPDPGAAANAAGEIIRYEYDSETCGSPGSPSPATPAAAQTLSHSWVPSPDSPG